MIPLGHYLILGALLFAIAVVGIFLNRKNLIILLMAIELMLLAVNMNFIAFAHRLGDLSGQVFVFFILTVGILMAGEMIALVVRGAAGAGAGPDAPPADFSNTKALGRVLYTDYLFPFEIAAVILLVAIVAAIALTLRERKTTKYQHPSEQLLATKAERLKIVKR